MNFFTYFDYFYYISNNWGVRLAFFVLYHEIKGEIKYGINTTGHYELEKLKEKGIDISHATFYMPTSYYLLEKAFYQLEPSPRAHFLDIGCGKGRPLCVAAFKGFKKITGVDFSDNLCAIARENIERINQPVVASIVNADILHYEIPADTDCLFFFNPFDEVIMEQVVKNIGKSFQHNPRNIQIIYANPLYQELFTHAGFKETYHFSKMHYLEFSILVLENPEPTS